MDYVGLIVLMALVALFVNLLTLGIFAFFYLIHSAKVKRRFTFDLEVANKDDDVR